MKTKQAAEYSKQIAVQQSQLRASASKIETLTQELSDQASCLSPLVPILQGNQFVSELFMS